MEHGLVSAKEMSEQNPRVGTAIENIPSQTRPKPSRKSTKSNLCARLASRTNPPTISLYHSNRAKSDSATACWSLSHIPSPLEPKASSTFKTHDNKSINMFRKFGKLTDDIVDSWCHDLDVGVVKARIPDGSLDRYTPCDYDETNKEWSGEALLNSCTSLMKKTVERYVPITNRVGPRVLWCINSNCETSSSEVVRTLCHKLKSMSLRTIPGENVQAFATQALAKVEVIRTKCQGNEPDDLTQLALRGLTEATDEGVCLEAKQLLREANIEQVLTQL